MAQLGELPITRLAKCLAVGDSGGGKTGALAGLAKAGFTLAIYDYDNGHQILMDDKILPKEFRKNVYVNVYQDEIMATPSGPRWKEPLRAWSRSVEHLANHPDLGPVSKFTDRHVIVIDSLTFQGRAALRYILQLQGRLNAQPYIQDWGQAMDMQENLLSVLYSSAIPCHVIVNAHITFQGGGESPQNDVMENLLKLSVDAKKSGQEVDPNVEQAIKNLAPSITPERGYPSALGNKLPPRVGRYFNTMVRIKSIGAGSSERKVFVTRSEPNLELKVPIPSKIPPTIPIDTGWTTIFDAIMKG